MNKKVKVSKIAYKILPKRIPQNTIKFLLLLMILLISLTLAGCSEVNVRIENLLNINSAFSGERTLTCNFGKEYAADEEKQEIIRAMIKDACPDNLAYDEIKEENEFKYEFKISFASLDEYKAKVKSIIGRDISVALENPQSTLANGWSYTEDFDSMELITWFENEIKIKGYKDILLKFESISNVVNYNGNIVSSAGSTLNIFEIEGYAINGIYIETTNNKDGTYDRRLTFSIPQETYNSMGSGINTVMVARTDPDLAVFNGWINQGNYQEYQILYQGIDLKNLQRVTTMFLDSNNADIYYGDENQSSTPLAEQLVFEENLSINGYIPQKDKPITFKYKYSLPIKTTYGQGAVFQQGVWEKQGEWIDGVYTLQSEGSVYDIRIPDGMQYTITGIDVNLNSFGNDDFERTFDFIYDKNNGEEGQAYAYNFLKNKGFTVSKEKSQKGIVCRITQKGTAEEISSALGDLFGGGNYISYENKTSAMAVVTDITFTDNINIDYMLIGDNVEVPFNYMVKSIGGENINDVSAENMSIKGTPKTVQNKDKSYTVMLTGGESSITYVATVPYFEGVLTYCLISGGILALAILLILFFFRKTKKLNKKDKEKLLITQKSEQTQSEKSTPKEDFKQTESTEYEDDNPLLTLDDEYYDKF